MGATTSATAAPSCARSAQSTWAPTTSFPSSRASSASLTSSTSLPRRRATSSSLTAAFTIPPSSTAPTSSAEHRPFHPTLPLHSQPVCLSVSACVPTCATPWCLFVPATVHLLLGCATPRASLCVCQSPSPPRPPNPTPQRKK